MTFVLAARTDPSVGEEAWDAAELALIYDTAPVGLCVLDLDLRYLRINARMAEINGVPAAAHLGRSVEEVLPALAGQAAAVVRRVLETGEAVAGIEFVGETPAQPGVKRTWLENWHPLRDGRGRIVAVTVMAEEITSRKAAEAALVESELRFRRLADELPAMVWVTDPDGQCLFLNRRWYEFTGQREEDGLGLGWLDALHPDDRTPAKQAFLLANRSQAPLRLEYRLRQVDGTYRWTIDSAQPRFADNGRFLGYVGSVIDISERRETEERQQLLMREVDHRAKNLLAAMLSLVRLTRDASAGPFADRLEKRIASMAQAHELLAASQWSGVPLRRLLARELSPYLEDTDAAVAVGSPEVTVRADAVQAVGMVLHELATNAAKYGALSRPDGKVLVSWSRDADALHLLWREEGGPMIAPPGRGGFGSTLIDLTVGRQLSGAVSREWRPEGLVVTLRIDAVFTT